MESQEQQPKSRVIKVESVESWDFYITQATNQACPIVVHFTALWCMPSVAMNPVFEELASSYPDGLFLIVDVDAVKVINSLLEPRMILPCFSAYMLTFSACTHT